MAGTGTANEKSHSVGVVVPYWPLHAAKLAVVSGLSALVFLGVLMRIRTGMNPIRSDPGPIFRGAITTADDAGPKFKTYTVDDVNNLVMMLWFAGLSTVTFCLQFSSKDRKGGVPYWPLRAARVASTTALCVMLATGILSRIRPPPPGAVLRGAIKSASVAENGPVGGLDLSFAIVMVWFCCLGALALFTNVYCENRGAGKGVPYWPLRAARVASTSAFCAFAFFGLLSQLRTPTGATLLRGAVSATAPASAVVRGVAVAAVAPTEVLGGRNYAKMVFQCVGALLVLLAFGAQVYSQAACMLKFRDGFVDEPKKATKKQ